MDKSGTVTIRVSSENDVVLIAVTDYGGGLDPAFADSIFEPFITSKNGGSGLGLVITKQIVERFTVIPDLVTAVPLRSLYLLHKVKHGI